MRKYEKCIPEPTVQPGRFLKLLFNDKKNFRKSVTKNLLKSMSINLNNKICFYAKL